MDMAPIFFILFVWVVMGVLISAVVKGAKKNMPKKRGDPRIPSRNAQDAARQMSVQDLPAEEAPGAAVPGEMASGAAPAAADASFRPLRPTVRLNQRDDSLYRGSLNAVTGEGDDPCHDEQMAPLNLAEAAPETVPVSAPGLRLTWTPSDVVHGFVVSEILSRRHP